MTARGTGVGFDFEDSAKAPPLDLAIMRERLKLVDGNCPFNLKPDAARLFTHKFPCVAKLLPRKQRDKSRANIHEKTIKLRNAGAWYESDAVSAAVPPAKPSESDRSKEFVQNGQTIIDRQEIPGITGGALDSHEAPPGPIYLQGSEAGHVAFRNITITPGEVIKSALHPNFY